VCSASSLRLEADSVGTVTSDTDSTALNCSCDVAHPTKTASAVDSSTDALVSDVAVKHDPQPRTGNLSVVTEDSALSHFSQRE